MIRVAMVGALGRMGSSIIRNVAKADDMELVAAIEKSGNPHIGKDVGRLLGLGALDIKLASSDDLDDAIANGAPDVVVDFTSADTAMETVKVAANNKVGLVLGTTGLDKTQMIELGKLVKEGGISAVMSPNMATGVNIFFTLVRAAASMYEDCDIEIIEAHHRHKKDAPSGTAVRAGELIAETIGKDIDKDGVFGRPRGVIGERGKEIGFHAIRGGDIVGEHTVLYAGDGERLEITHRAHSRQAFVSGTIKAIRFVNKNKRTGKVFSTFDVLGL